MGVLLVTECLYFDVLRTILVGNFSDGTINAFDSTGESLGQVTDSGIGARGTGNPNTLYFTAG
jgi:hypothetical protein